jgi:hypothetical protein
MEKTKEIFQYALAVIIVFVFMIIVLVVFKIALPAGNKEIGLMVIGALVAKFGDIVSYFFGSSKSSSDKTKILERQNEKTKL